MTLQLLWPIRDGTGYVSQRFGANPNHPQFGYGPAGHTGLDFGGCYRLPVVAARSGWATCHDSGNAGYGKHVRITDGNTLVLYGHLDSISAAEGWVNAGDVLGIVGNTGNSYGAHLHLELRVDGRVVDPEPHIVKEGPVSKLGLHFQNLPGWAGDVVNGSNVGWVKLIDPSGSANPFPGKRIIGRLWIGGDDVEQRYIDRGRLGAEDYFTTLLPRYLAAPWVTCWEGPNEPLPYWDRMVHLNAFSARWVELMHQHNLQAVVGCFSVGRPDTNTAHAMKDALREADYLALHEYARQSMTYGQGWLCLRYRRTVAELKAAGCRVPPILITECGIDGGAVLPSDEALKEPGKGWRSYTDREGYMAQLAWYDGELSKDPYVLAATPFVSGPSGDWLDFDVDEHLARWLVARHGATPEPPAPAPEPLPEDETATDAATLADKCRWWLEEEQRQREAGNTARANAIRLSLIELLYRLENTLKGRA